MSTIDPDYLKFEGLDEHNFPIEHIQPIPLTPEWLEKLGGTQPYEDQPEFWQIGLFFFKLHDQYGLCQWDEEGQYIVFGTVHYDYVHQIQNLFFALTQSELIIKE